MLSLKLKIAAFALALAFCLANRTYAAEDCEFGNLHFSPYMKIFAGRFDMNGWVREDLEDFMDGTLAQRFSRCQEWKKIREPQIYLFEQTHGPSCSFRNQTDPLYSDMDVIADEKFIYQLRFHFKRDVVLPDPLHDLKNNLGNPAKTAEYRQAGLRHRLLEWHFTGCRIIYDYREFDGATTPVYLIFEKFPQKYADFPGGNFVVTYLK